MSISTEQWLGQIEQQVKNYRENNTLPNPLVQIDVVSMNTLISLARRGLNMPAKEIPASVDRIDPPEKNEVSPSLNNIISTGKLPWSS